MCSLLSEGQDFASVVSNQGRLVHLVSIIKACVKQLCSALLLKAAQSFLKWHLSKNELRSEVCVVTDFIPEGR